MWGGGRGEYAPHPRERQGSRGRAAIRESMAAAKNVTPGKA